MKRRDALKALTTAASSVMLGFQQKPATASGDLIAKPVRALTRKNGRLVQPIHIAMPASIPEGAVVRVDGTAYPHDVLPGTPAQIEVFLPGVRTERKATVTLDGETSVSKYLVRSPKPPSQIWRTFLENHLESLVSVDFFTVPTIRFQILYVFPVPCRSDLVSMVSGGGERRSTSN